MTDKVATYVLHADEGNSWLEVPLEDMRQLGATDLPGADSRMTLETAYLDADEGNDADRFLAKAAEAGWEIVQSPDVKLSDHSPVRHLGNYSAYFAQNPPGVDDTITLADGGRGKITGIEADAVTGQPHFLIETGSGDHALTFALDTRFITRYSVAPQPKLDKRNDSGLSM
ncbi:MAG: hypothetical protein Alpg2KO_29790 [Alphaproteobacteria bacterium]